MQINVRQSVQGVHVRNVYVNNEYVGFVKGNPRTGLLAVKKGTGESSPNLFATEREAAEWLVGNHV